MRSNPYAHIGLARNPFAAQDHLPARVDIWIDRGYSVAPLPMAKHFVQFLGDKGFGKTALRLWWAHTGISVVGQSGLALPLKPLSYLPLMRKLCKLGQML